MSDSDETTIVSFNACKYLDFSDNYSARKQIISLEQIKVFWLRDVPPDLPAMVQFCSKRGRLNSPTDCLDCAKARCGDYLEAEHVVHVPNP